MTNGTGQRLKRSVLLTFRYASTVAIIYVEYLNVRSTDLFNLCPVPLVINKLRGTKVILLGLVGPRQWRIGSELFSQVIHQFFKCCSIRYIASIELALLSDFCHKNFCIIYFSVLVQSSFLLLFNSNRIFLSSIISPDC